jgi:tRNA threonylcarbamoyladenosine biosynthesis protein TsaE
MLQISYSLGSIQTAADQLWQYAHQYRVVAFSGQMGAGKTTFVHELCAFLGVTDAVSSPTFALINEYHFDDENGKDTRIFHMDWYRIRDTEEAINAGMEDALLSGDYCFVEWPEQAPELLPHPHIWVTIAVISDTERQMTVSVKQ